jgi:hypothetical protein
MNSIAHLPIIFPIAFVAALSFVLVLLQITTSGKSKKNTSGEERLGGIYNDTVDIAFVHPYEIGLIYTAMTQITSGCTPIQSPIPDPIYNSLFTGSLASTRASWLLLKNQLLLSNTCTFYGLDAATIRTGLIEGPADLCQAYTAAGLEYFAVNKMTPQIEADLSTYLFNAVIAAYPLNLYWKNSLGANWITDVVLPANTGLLAEIQNFHSAFHSNGSDPALTDVVDISTRFCNQYFATDQPQYHEPALMPYLAFPYEGLINRRTGSNIVPALNSLLGKLTIPQGFDFKHVYIIDSPTTDVFSTMLSSSSVVQLFIKTMFPPSVPVTIISGQTVDSALDAIVASITTTINGIQIPSSINVSMTPVMVIARYVDDAQTYSAFKVPASTVMFAFDPEDPLDVLQGEYLGTVLQNAASHASVSIVDFMSYLPMEQKMGERYRMESQVSDILNLIIGSTVFAGTTDAWDILDTFSIKNTLIGTNDVGDRLEIERSMRQMELDGIALGLQNHPFAMELTQTVLSSLEDDDEEEDGGFFGSGSWSGSGIPARLDWRELAPACIYPSQDQGQCNNCWAIASTATISGRLCIKQGARTSEESARTFLSTQQVTACSRGVFTTTDGCAPQQPSAGFSFLSGDVTSRRCMSEVFRGSSTNGRCPQTCRDGRAPELAGGAVRGSYTQLQNASAIKAALQKGPVAIGIMFPTDFFSRLPLCSPTSESYIFPVSDDMTFVKPGGHMMTCWGYDDTTSPPSWIIQNSHGCSSSANRDQLIQGNRGFIRLAQDVQGVLKGRAFWVDYNGYVATARAAPTTPGAVVPSLTTSAGTITGASETATASLNQLINSNAPVSSQAGTFTSSSVCPTAVINQRQAARQSQIQGCPGSADNLKLNSGAVSTYKGEISIKGILLTLLISMLMY